MEIKLSNNRFEDKYLWYDDYLVSHRCGWCGHTVSKLVNVYSDETLELYDIFVCMNVIFQR